MPSDRPLPDRCGARVTDKIGLEIIFDNGETILDEDVVSVRLEDSADGTTIDAVPNYCDIREYLWDDYEVVMVAVEPSTAVAENGTVTKIIAPQEADTQVGNPKTRGSESDYQWLALDHVEKVTNHDHELQGFCERYPMKEIDRCYVHQGGGAPEGNTNPMKHGLYAQRTNYYNALEDDDKEFVEAMVDAWIGMSPYERDNVGIVNELYRCAIDQLRAWGGIEEFVNGDELEGLTKEMVIGVSESGQPITAEDEHPVNMAYSRLDRDVRTKLKELGIYDSPEKQQADATESLAQKLSGLTQTDE